ncbi:MAG: SH3 domain-containing protein [Gammaproteobacteria bacterium]|nr:SH3 domain-containing protein [Gammaproteobacteria bacterium]
MRINNLLAGTLFLIVFLLSSPVAAGLSDLFGNKPGTETKVTAGQNSPDLNQVQAESYNGPKARVAVSRFTNKTQKRWWTREIGDGMADQMVTALFNSNRYIVLERQTINDVLAEQNLGAAGRISRDTAAPVGQIIGAELLITGAVTEFEANASGTRGSAGGLLGNVVGAITSGVRRAHMAIDVRVIDARTSRILAATSVEGSSTDVDIGGAVGGYFGRGVALGGALSSWENTPKEKALRACINKAVDFIVSKTPTNYYRHGAGRRTASASSRRSSTPKKVPQYEQGSVVRVKSKSLNIRQGPGTHHPVVFSATNGTPLMVEGQQNKWLNVRTQTGQVGWTAGWLVSLDRSTPPDSFSTTKTTATTNIPVKQSPTPAAPQQGRTVEARLKQLKNLYENNLITEEEYKEKRDKVISEL